MDIAKIIERIRNLMFTPRTEWPAIANDGAPAASIYTGHVLVLAAVAALASWLSIAAFGSMMRGFGLGSSFGLVTAIWSFASSFLGVFIVSWLAKTIAPNFGGVADSHQALKTVAYSWTAVWLGQIGGIVPILGFLIMIAAVVYTIWQFYLGCQHTLKVPADKAAGFTAVVIIAGIVTMAALSWILSPITSRMMLGSASNPDSPAAAITAAAAAAAAAAAGSGDAAEKAAAVATAAAAAAASGRSFESLAADDIKSFIPESVGGMNRVSFKSERNQAMGMQVSEARATYDSGDGKRIDLEITDTGGAAAFAALAGVVTAIGEMESETDTGYERARRDGDRWIHEEWNKVEGRGEYTVFVANRFIVQANGDAGSIDELRAVVNAVDIARLESLKNAGAK
jgi:hypothetical protein